MPKDKEEKTNKDATFYIAIVVFILLVLYLVWPRKEVDVKKDVIRDVKQNSAPLAVPAVPQYSGQLKNALNSK